jgi:hypothetical protein
MLKKDNFREILKEVLQAIGEKIFVMMDPCFWYLTRYHTPEERGIPPAEIRKPENWRIFTFFEEINSGIGRFAKAWIVYLRKCGLKE